MTDSSGHPSGLAVAIGPRGRRSRGSLRCVLVCNPLLNYVVRSIDLFHRLEGRFRRGDQTISGRVNLAHIFHSGRVDEAPSSHVVDEFGIGGTAAFPGHGWGTRWWECGGGNRLSIHPFRTSVTPEVTRPSHTAPKGHVCQSLSPLFVLNDDHPVSRQSQTMAVGQPARPRYQRLAQPRQTRPGDLTNHPAAIPTVNVPILVASLALVWPGVFHLTSVP